MQRFAKWELGEWKWEFSWRRELREWEQTWVEELLETIRNIPLSMGRKDRWEWRGLSKGGFTVKRAYMEIQNRRGNNSNAERDGFSFKAILKTIAPFKAKTMMWRLAWNKLPTMENLRKRLAIPAEEGICGCCGEAEESSHHFFLDCPMVQPIWHKFCIGVALAGLHHAPFATISRASRKL